MAVGGQNRPRDTAAGGQDRPQQAKSAKPESECLAENPDDEECDCKLRHYLEFFESLGRRTVFTAIGPPEECNEQNSSLCMIHFYEEAALETGGLWAPINVREGDVCEDADFGDVLGEIGDLLASL